jgi:hypothetical protein
VPNPLLDASDADPPSNQIVEMTKPQRLDWCCVVNPSTAPAVQESMFSFVFPQILPVPRQLLRATSILLCHGPSFEFDASLRYVEFQHPIPIIIPISSPREAEECDLANPISQVDIMWIVFEKLDWTTTAANVTIEWHRGMVACCYNRELLADDSKIESGKFGEDDLVPAAVFLGHKTVRLVFVDIVKDCVPDFGGQVEERLGLMNWDE